MGYFLMIAGFVGVPACLVILIVKAIRKKKLKTTSLIMAGLFVCFVAGIILAPKMTPDEREVYNAEQQLKKDQRELEDAEREESERIAAEQATAEKEKAEREAAQKAEDERIAAERAERARIEAEEEAAATAQLEADRLEDERLAVTFDEIYKAYKENELRADDKYQYNRYRITAKINGMATGGLLNLFGGATLTMEKRVGDTIVFFYAEFEAEQEEALKEVNVGDTITFDGECLSAGSWVECEIVK